MRSLRSHLPIALLCPLLAAACAAPSGPQPEPAPGQTTDASAAPSESPVQTAATPELEGFTDPGTVYLDATVGTFVMEPPRRVVLRDAVDGHGEVWFDEVRAGDGYVNETEAYSADGCPLGGPPLQAGDRIRVTGHLDDRGRLVADTMWMLDTEIGGGCSGPPANPGPAAP